MSYRFVLRRRPTWNFFSSNIPPLFFFLRIVSLLVCPFLIAVFHNQQGVVGTTTKLAELSQNCVAIPVLTYTHIWRASAHSFLDGFSSLYHRAFPFSPLFSQFTRCLSQSLALFSANLYLPTPLNTILPRTTFSTFFFLPIPFLH